MMHLCIIKSITAIHLVQQSAPSSSFCCVINNHEMRRLIVLFFNFNFWQRSDINRKYTSNPLLTQYTLGHRKLLHSIYMVYKTLKQCFCISNLTIRLRHYLFANLSGYNSLQTRSDKVIIVFKVPWTECLTSKITFIALCTLQSQKTSQKEGLSQENEFCEIWNIL